jgi:hypothetical protein
MDEEGWSISIQGPRPISGKFARYLNTEGGRYSGMTGPDRSLLPPETGKETSPLPGHFPDTLTSHVP